MGESPLDNICNDQGAAGDGWAGVLSGAFKISSGISPSLEAALGAVMVQARKNELRKPPVMGLRERKDRKSAEDRAAAAALYRKEICQMYAEGMSVHEIAVDRKRKRKAILDLLAVSGVHDPRIYPVLSERNRQFVKSGCTMTELTARLECSPKFARAVLAASGLDLVGARPDLRKARKPRKGRSDG